MPTTQNIKIHFYQLQYNLLTPERTPAELSRQLSRLPGLTQFRSIGYYGTPVDIHDTGVRLNAHGLIVGTLIANQMENIPPRHNSSTKRERSLAEDMGDDEGLGRDSTFLIDPVTNVIAMENRTRSARPAALRGWLQHNLDLPDLRLGIVIHPNAMHRFLHLNKVVKIDLAIARPERSAGLLPNSEYDLLGSIARKSEEFNIDQITMSLQTDSTTRRGVNRDSLNIVKSRGLVDFLSSRSAEEVRKIKVFGYDGDERYEIIDLIEDKMEDSIRVPLPESRFVHTFNVAEHQQALVAAYLRKRDIIRGTYTIPDE